MRRLPSPGRTMAKRAITALCLLAMLLPAATVLAADPDPESRLDDVRRQIEDVQSEIEEVDRKRTVTLEDLNRIDAELAVLDDKLAVLTRELGGAQQVLSDAETRVAATTAELVATEQQLADTRDRLRHEREVFADRTRASFMYGAPTLPMAMFDAQDLHEFSRAVKYVERIMVNDRDRVSLVAGLVREVDAQTVELGALQDRQVVERQAAEAERNRVAGLVAEEEDLRAQVAAERHKRQLVLNQLESDRATHLAMVSALEAESDQIEAELRRREEARQRAEAEARAAEERRRQAAANGSSAGSSSTASAPASQPGKLQRPSNGRVTSGYGYRTHPIFGTRRMHTGVDFASGHGSPIFAAESGVVVSAGSRGGYGNTIILDHGGGMTTLYAHQSSFAVSAGQSVSRGQIIGYEGSTGYSTGPHLHFEVRINGAHTDPMPYL